MFSQRVDWRGIRVAVLERIYSICAITNAKVTGVFRGSVTGITRRGGKINAIS